jgi:hypothetical protein
VTRLVPKQRRNPAADFLAGTGILLALGFAVLSWLNVASAPRPTTLSELATFTGLWFPERSVLRRSAHQVGLDDYMVARVEIPNAALPRFIGQRMLRGALEPFSGEPPTELRPALRQVALPFQIKSGLISSIVSSPKGNVAIWILVDQSHSDNALVYIYAQEH